MGGSGAGARIANVSASLIVGSDTAPDAPTVARATRLLARLFEDVSVVGASAPGARSDDRPPGVPALVRALEAAREERVLVLDAGFARVTPALLLGLTAWPQHAFVAPRIEGAIQPLCAVYLRDEVLRRAAAAGEEDLHRFVERLDCGVLEAADVEPLLEASDALS